ncbi:MAG: LysM peptidoglycan-binding domain-containing protein [Arenicellales bacterium]|nr:LysM peptidoglycan-binding domain-containing protein [Arenicellales bacterium]
MNTGKAIRTLMILAAMGLFATGCVTAKQASQAASEGTQATPAPATTTTATATTTAAVTPAPATTTTTAAVTPAPKGIVGYVVQKGDHLWGISAKPAVYGDPYQWPLLYKRNRDEIYDPDLIYPGQVLHIERDLSQTQINIAVNHAKTRGAWVLGEIEATDIQYLRKALSW